MTDLRIYLRTRSVSEDYRFLGSTPSLDWCSALLPWINQSKPAVILRGSPEGWQLLMTGIPTHRKDASQTPIRYTLVATSPTVEPGLAAGWTELLSRHIERATNGQGAESESGLGDRLDQTLSEQFLERCLGHSGAPEPDVDSYITERLEALVAALGSSSLEGTKCADRWVADIQSPTQRLRWGAYVKALLEGQVGWAGYLNLGALPGVGQLSRELEGSLAFLIPRGPVVPQPLPPYAIATPTRPHRLESDPAPPATKGILDVPIGFLLDAAARTAAIASVLWDPPVRKLEQHGTLDQGTTPGQESP